MADYVEMQPRRIQRSRRVVGRRLWFPRGTVTTSIRTIEVDRWAWTRFIRDSGWMMLSSAFLVVAGVTRIVAPAWVVPYRIDYPKSQTALPGDALRTYGWIWLIVGLLLLTSEMLTSKTGDSCRAELLR